MMIDSQSVNNSNSNSDIYLSLYNKQLKDSNRLSSEIYSNGSKKELTCSNNKNYNISI